MMEEVNKKFDSILLNENIYNNLPHELFDIYLILIHFFLNKKQEIITISANDILNFREIKQISHKNFRSSGFNKIVKEKIIALIISLEKLNLLKIIEKNNYILKIKLNENYLNDKKIILPKKLLNFHPLKNSWHKDIGYYLSVYKQLKPKLNVIQIQKIMKIIKNNYCFLAPSRIRNRFENTMDELAQANIIQDWYYKNIDEDALNCKNWLWWWEKLSVKINFDILTQPTCFLNF